MSKYQIVIAPFYNFSGLRYPGDLEEKVNNLLKEGWETLGGASYSDDVIVQAMIKKEEAELVNLIPAKTYYLDKM